MEKTIQIQIVSQTLQIQVPRTMPGTEGPPGAGLELGAMRSIPHTTVPAGWMLCDGTAVSRSTYAALFALLGETWGSGDGTTTFNLPYIPQELHVVPATASQDIATASVITIIKVLP